ncbi:MAG: hypothetical protein QM804_19380 [Propionicimonas sp.]
MLGHIQRHEGRPPAHPRLEAALRAVVCVTALVTAWLLLSGPWPAAGASHQDRPDRQLSDIRG